VITAGAGTVSTKSLLESSANRVGIFCLTIRLVSVEHRVDFVPIFIRASLTTTIHLEARIVQ
jgi:hypothetical protein